MHSLVAFALTNPGIATPTSHPTPLWLAIGMGGSFAIALLAFGTLSVMREKFITDHPRSVTAGMYLLTIGVAGFILFIFAGAFDWVSATTENSHAYDVKVTTWLHDAYGVDAPVDKVHEMLIGHESGFATFGDGSQATISISTTIDGKHLAVIDENKTPIQPINR